ncbi:MAG: SMC-Scp complex subunit ScpB [bacterium]|nr:SMC-Scp complex subunit ScpB [bacterium]
MTIDAQIEAVLFATAKPLSFSYVARLLEVSVKEVEDGVLVLRERLESSGSGLTLQEHEGDILFVTRPECAEVVVKVIKEASAGELTRPSLETLTILAYRGPLTRPEIEQIRGVQSSLILRNLMIRGLVEEKGMGDLGQDLYGLTMECLKALGIESVQNLPQYEELRGHASIQDVLADLEENLESKEEKGAETTL